MERAEHWRPVVGYENTYEVSDRGRVRSLDRLSFGGTNRRIQGRILTPWVAKGYGYYSVSLFGEDGRKNRTIHSLVAEAFIGPRPEGMEVCHGPAGAGDNSPANLRYGTRSSNLLDRTRDGTNKFANRTHCPREHLLVEPNLMPSQLKRGRRSCLACSRARALVAWKRDVDFREEADRYYRSIMEQQ